MEALWTLWLATALVGALLGAARRPSRSGWQFDALLVFLLSSVVCDGLAALGTIDGWRLNPYAISAGFVVGALLRSRLGRTPMPAGSA